MADNHKHSDNDAYASRHETPNMIDLINKEPRIEGPKPDGQSDLADSISQSPQSQRNGGADPQMFDPGHGDYWPDPTKVDAANEGTWGVTKPYEQMYEPKK